MKPLKINVYRDLQTFVEPRISRDPAITPLDLDAINRRIPTVKHEPQEAPHDTSPVSTHMEEQPVGAWLPIGALRPVTYGIKPSSLEPSAVAPPHATRESVEPPDPKRSKIGSPSSFSGAPSGGGDKPVPTEEDLDVPGEDGGPLVPRQRLLPRGRDALDDT